MIITLPNGSSFIISDDKGGARIIMYMIGMSFGAEVLDLNDETPGSFEWANKEIELYEQALEIDLKEYRNFIADCIIGQAMKAGVSTSS